MKKIFIPEVYLYIFSILSKLISTIYVLGVLYWIFISVKNVYYTNRNICNKI